MPCPHKTTQPVATTSNSSLQKKKCDETRPSCARCAERGLSCSYEAVRPRQRRKRDSIISFPSTTGTDPFDRRLSFASTRRWSQGSFGSDNHGWFRDRVDSGAADLPAFSPLETSFDHASLPSLSDLSSLVSPSAVHELAIDFDDEDSDQDHPEGTGASSSTLATTSRAVTHISRPPDLAMIAPCPVGSPLLDFRMPAFAEFSHQKNRRALVAHFCNQLSHLIVFREESGNPFQKLVLPLTATSSPVMNAIWALASAHLEYRGVENREQSLHFHSEAIQGLATMIDRDGKKADRNELLATIMLLVYYEVVRGRTELTSS